MAIAFSNATALGRSDDDFTWRWVFGVREIRLPSLGSSIYEHKAPAIRQEIRARVWHRSPCSPLRRAYEQNQLPTRDEESIAE